MSVNADPQELAKFSELAHRWWDPNSAFKPLHQINPLRLEWIERVVGGCSAHSTVLTSARRIFARFEGFWSAR